ncbi:DDE superfamily endonuclease CENP B [Elysia marginata]|uniref:DDE superfamily endonuclease CENP B n=1 Tax=Elysia marginata TaxID=1093978 RepID=A0AAV4JG11_9GAST|nr:DDE superfamily endonuclease CENP B [Elysia marginata]
MSEEEPYTHTQHLRLMLQAVDAVISGQMSQREAAKAFNIPRSTLRCHLPRHETYKHKVQKQPSNSRGKAIFSKKEEKELVDYLVNMHRCGFGRTRKDFMLKLQDTLNKAERKTKFDDNMPTDEWFTAFLERHKDTIKECVIGVDTQEKGLIPADVFGVSQQVIEEAVQSVITEAPASTVTIHQSHQQPQQHHVQHHHHHQQPQHIEIGGSVSPTTYHQLTVQQQQHPHQTLQGHTVQGFGPFQTDSPGLNVCLQYTG